MVNSVFFLEFQVPMLLLAYGNAHDFCIPVFCLVELPVAILSLECFHEEAEIEQRFYLLCLTRRSRDFYIHLYPLYRFGNYTYFSFVVIF